MVFFLKKILPFAIYLVDCPVWYIKFQDFKLKCLIY